ncbi:MAG: DUF4331 domain-containing protein, partial [Dehalococcoidia bacterium]
APDAPDRVTFVMNVWPFSNPSGGPNFYLFNPDAVYAINVDNDGDASADLRFEFTFRTDIRDGDTFLYNTGPVTTLDDPDLNIRQFMNAERVDMHTGVRTRITADWPVAPSNVGIKSMPNYEDLARQAIYEIPGTGKFFSGQRDDPFYVDLALFDLLSIRSGPPGNMGGGADTLAGYSVNSIIMQMATSDLLGNSPIIGAWSTVSRDGTQVSRLGQPLVNEAVIPLKLKDAFNSIPPSADATVPEAVASVTDPILPKLLKAIYNVDSPPAPRNDLVTIFLQGIPMLNQPEGVSPAEMLRLNTSIAPAANPNRMGVLGGDTAGFPNGRRLGDDVVDIALQAMAGATPFTPEFNRAPNNQLGDGVDANDKPSLSSFPYVASPNPGSDTAGVRPAR